MENEAIQKPGRIRADNNNNKWGGVVLIIIGVVFLLQRIPQTSGWFPDWFFTWPVLLIGIGIFTGVKSGFKNLAWLILILIGGYSLLHHNNLIGDNLRPYALPLGLILLGAFVMMKKNKRCTNHPRFKRWQPGDTSTIDISEDILNVNSTFGSVEKNVFSKNFKGGNISCIFGGGQINFAHADFEGIAVLDVSIIFGGMDIVLPANWNLKNEISVVFGGIEDKRRVLPNGGETAKTLILKGNIMFGGIEIKSY